MIPMKLKKSLLQPLLKAVAGLVRGKSTIELFQHVRMFTEGGRLYLAATNGSAGIQTVYPEPVTEEFDALVPPLFADNLSETLNEEIELHRKGDILQIIAGKSKSTLNLLPNENLEGLWPSFDMDGEGKRYFIPGDELKTGIEYAGIAISNNTPEHLAGSPARGNVCVRLGETNHIGGVYPFAFVNYSFPGDEDQVAQLLIPYRYATAFTSFFESMVQLKERNGKIYLHSGKTTMWASLTSGAFIEYWKYYPTVTHTFGLPYGEVKEFLAKTNALVKDGGGNHPAFFFTYEEGVVDLRYLGERGSTNVAFEHEGGEEMVAAGIMADIFTKMYNKDMVLSFGGEGNGIMIMPTSRDGKVQGLITNFVV